MSPLPSDGERRPKIAVVFGGRSSEHQVSCLTAREVLAVVDRDRFDVRAIGITREGDWVEETGVWRDLPAGVLPEVRASNTRVPWETVREADVVFPLLHGPWGEDGTLQGLLEMADVRFVGAGVLASALSMDKHYSKVVFAAGGLPQVQHVTVMPGQWDKERDKVSARIKALGLPVFVKPARAGSSAGVTRVNDFADLDAAMVEASAHDPKVLVEAGVAKGRELECAVIQTLDGSPQASVVGEIVVGPASGHAFYDFEAKYLDGTSTNVVPAELPVTVAERIRSYAIKAFEAVGCEGLARVDFFLTDHDLFINEINTMPGFTPYSMFPSLWAASGVAYPELVDRLIDLALARETGLR